MLQDKNRSFSMTAHNGGGGGSSIRVVGVVAVRGAAGEVRTFLRSNISVAFEIFFISVAKSCMA
jgi:hypothetical protein